MNRRYNSNYNRRQQYPQIQPAGAVPITLGWKPSINPDVLQAGLQRADQRYNLAKTMPQSLVAGLNKAKLDPTDRSGLANHFDTEIKAIQKIVSDKYKGDWGAASDEILGRVNSLQGDITKGEQAFISGSKVREEAESLQRKGMGVYDHSGVLNSNNGYLNINNGQVNVRNIPNDLRYFDKEGILGSINTNVSTALNRQMSESGLMDDPDVKGMLRSQNYQGVSDKGVESYYNGEDGQALLVNQMEMTPQWDIQMKARYGEDWRETHMEKAKKDFKDVVKSQTSLQLKNQYRNNPGFNKEGGPSYNDRFTPSIDSRYRIGGVSILGAENLGFDPKNITPNLTEEKVKNDPGLKQQFEYVNKIKAKADEDIIKYIDPENIAMQVGGLENLSMQTGTEYTKELQYKTLKLIKNKYPALYAEDAYSNILDMIRTGDIKSNTPVKDLKSSDLAGTVWSWSDDIKNAFINAGIKTVGEAATALKVIELGYSTYLRSNDTNVREIGDWYDHSFYKNNTENIKESNTKVSEYSKYNVGTDEITKTKSFFEANESFLPEELLDNSKFKDKGLENFNMEIQQTKTGPIIAFKDGEETFKVITKDMKKESVLRLSALQRSPSLYTEWAYYNDPKIGAAINDLKRYEPDQAFKDASHIPVNKFKVIKFEIEGKQPIFGVLDEEDKKIWTSKMGQSDYAFTKAGAIDAAILLQGGSTPAMQAMAENLHFVDISKSQYRKNLLINLGLK